MLIEYLMTTVNKSKNEIKELLDNSNICGEIIVGNQLSKNHAEYEILTSKYHARVFDTTDRGVSKNRNFLILKANSDFITFLDDDMYYEDGIQATVESIVKEKSSSLNCIRFNVVSDNHNRTIKQLKKDGFVGFHKLSSFGVWGCFFRRQFLLDNNLFFREDIGPGTEINHGEDGLFIKTFLKRSKIYCKTLLAFHVRQSDSTWLGANRNLELEMFSHGYLYQLLYPAFPRLMARMFIHTHMDCYPKGTSKAFLKNHMFNGIKAAKSKTYKREGCQRILILGPVISEKTSGGVAVFDEGLCKGFRELGDIVNILSIEKSLSINNITLKMKKPSALKILLSFGRISKRIKNYQPDLVISSLQYSIGIKRYKKAWPSARYVQVLHGFPCPINGKAKSYLINKTAKYAKKHFDFTVTVSFLSYAINKKINNILCDKVIHNGTSLSPDFTNRERIYDFIYIGRLFRDKEVEMISEAFAILKSMRPELRFVVAGYGELTPLFTEGKFKASGIEYVGKLSQKQVDTYLEQSKFFISMNPLEPFGIVFGEAATRGCNIIAQSSMGSAPLFFKKSYYHIADCHDSTSLSQRLLEIIPEFSEIDKTERNRISEYLSFKRVAKEYKELIQK